ncbi:Transcription elongation factor A protein 2, partial [Nowakowskiella sp. JEL0078]
MGNQEKGETLVDLKDKLTKAIADGEREKVLDILKNLLAITVTKDLLKQTNLGKVVNNIRKIESLSEEAKALSKSVIDKWKKDVEGFRIEILLLHGILTLNSEGSKTLSETSIPSQTQFTVLNKPTPTKPLPPVSLNTNTSSIQNVRTIQSDNVTFKKISPNRDHFVGLLYKTLANNSDVESKIVLDIVLRIEEAVHYTHIGKESAYQARFRTMISSLRGNDSLRESILLGEEKPEDVAIMSAEDMLAEDMKKKKEGAEKLAIHNAQVAKAAQSETDIFQCGK